MHLYRVEKPSRSELNHLLGEIQADIEYVNEEINFYETANSALDRVANRLSAKKSNQSQQRQNLTDQYLEQELECSASNMDASDTEEVCDRFSATSKTLTDSLAQESMAIAIAEEFPWNADYKASYIELLKARRDALEGEKRRVLDVLGSVSDTFVGFLESDREIIASVIDSKKEDNWLQFEYNSEEEKKSSKSFRSKKSYKQNIDVKWWGRTFVGHHTKHTTTNSSSTNKTSKIELKVKGKLLRVHIKRPWFKPEVFDDKNLDFVSYEQLLILIMHSSQFTTVHVTTHFRCTTQKVVVAFWDPQEATCQRKSLLMQYQVVEDLIRPSIACQNLFPPFCLSKI